MHYKVTAEQIADLASSKSVYFDDQRVKASTNMQNICKTILDKSLLNFGYVAYICETAASWQLYLKRKKGRR